VRAAHSASEPAPGVQPTVTTVAKTADLFNLHPMVATNLHCIPTAALSRCARVCRDAAKMSQRALVIKLRRP